MRSFLSPQKLASGVTSHAAGKTLRFVESFADLRRIGYAHR
jgi:hypothetical protein